MGILKGPIALALVKLVMDPTDYVKSIAKIKSTLMPLAALTAGAFAIGGMINFAKKAVQISSDFNEIRNRFKVTFEGIGAEAEMAANTIGAEFDLAGGTIRQILADTGTLAVGLGYSREKALEMASAVARLSGDLASYQDVVGGASEANQRLQSLLMGNMRAARESLRIFVIQDAAFKKRVKHLMKVNKLTEEQAKVEVRLEMAVKRSVLALNDYVRTRHTYANQIRANAEANKDFLETAGVTYRRMVEASDGIGIWNRYLRRWGEEIKKLAQDRSLEKMTIAITVAFRLMVNHLGVQFNLVGGFIGDLWHAWISFVRLYVDSMKKLKSFELKGIFQNAKDAADNFLKPWRHIGDNFKKAGDNATEIIGDAQKQLKRISNEGMKGITDDELAKQTAIDETTKAMKAQMFGAENLRSKMQQTFLGNTKVDEVLKGANNPSTMPSRAGIDPSNSVIMSQIKTVLGGIKEVGMETNKILEGQRERHGGYAYGVVQ